MKHNYFTLTLASLVLVGCSGSSFSGSASKRTGTKAGKGSGPSEVSPDQSQTDSGGAAGSRPGGADVKGGALGGRSKDVLPNVDQVKVLCSARNAKVLILDFKSGWFAGDGGDFYKTFVNPNCRSTIDVSYAHITQSVIETNFSASPAIGSVLPCVKNDMTMEFGKTRSLDTACAFKTPTDYDQVWILSGSEQDGDDVKLNSAFFDSVVAGLKAHHVAKPKTAYFLSAGLGNSDHSNAISKALFAENVFGPNPFPQQGIFPSVEVSKGITSDPLLAGSGLAPGTFDSSAVLFAGMSRLEDYKRGLLEISKGGSFDCMTDPIVSKSIITLATDKCGRAAIGAAKFGESRVIAEGNTARFYKTKPEDYFHRIIAMLLAP